MSPAVDAARVIADLRELARRTSRHGSALRVGWGPEWAAARTFLGKLLEEIGLAPEVDEAGNLWTYLEGDGEPALALGSHIDSVPEGGWLDGALGAMAAVGVLRAWAASDDRPPRSLAFVDWADEEGRFGRSLLGSSAVSGSLDPAELAGLWDPSRLPIEKTLADNGVALQRMPQAAARLDRIGALLELHIEQGPVLEAEGLPIAAVSGTVGIERWRLRFEGSASHAGTTPMKARRDAGLAAAETALAAERIARELGGVATTGVLQLHPGAATVIPGVAELTVDLRHSEADSLAAMLRAARSAAQHDAAARGCDVSAERIWAIEPIEFDAGLVELAREACVEVAGTDRVLVSGALHDAAEIARRRPAAMLFVRSLGGISHSPQEDSSEEDLSLAIRAYAELAERAMSRA